MFFEALKVHKLPAEYASRILITSLRPCSRACFFANSWCHAMIPLDVAAYRFAGSYVAAGGHHFFSVILFSLSSAVLAQTLPGYSRITLSNRRMASFG
jgi:hypothetical protein